MGQTRYTSLAFDLDDTLLDTSGLLVPEAARRACQVLIEAGVECDLHTCLEVRKKMAPQSSHQEIFNYIHSQFGNSQSQNSVEKALAAFYNPQVPQTLPLMTGSLENLEILKQKYRLFLVTMGSRHSQEKKIKALNIAHHFEQIYILDSFKGEKKDQAFRDILKHTQHPAVELLSIGNRLSSEIRDAKKLGATTCYFAYGEHVGETPQLPEDHPDFTIFHHQELIPTCGL